MKAFKPNDITHKAFGDTLRKAEKSGVGILAYDCEVTPEHIEISEEVEIIFKKYTLIAYQNDESILIAFFSSLSFCGKEVYQQGSKGRTEVPSKSL